MAQTSWWSLLTIRKLSYRVLLTQEGQVCAPWCLALLLSTLLDSDGAWKLVPRYEPGHTFHSIFPQLHLGFQISSLKHKFLGLAYQGRTSSISSWAQEPRRICLSISVPRLSRREPTSTPASLNPHQSAGKNTQAFPPLPCPFLLPPMLFAMWCLQTTYVTSLEPCSLKEQLSLMAVLKGSGAWWLTLPWKRSPRRGGTWKMMPVLTY